MAPLAARDSRSSCHTKISRMTDLVRRVSHDAGALWQISFGSGKGNILDRATASALRQVFADAAVTDGLKAVCLEGHGDHFSYGASVREHRRDEVRSMLAEMRALLFAMLDCNVTVIACVRGQCLGGGLEVASLCHRVVARADAVLGQPEIALGVFAPFASVVLPERIGRRRAEELCLSGRAISAAEAREIGLVDEVDDIDPSERARDWARRHLLPHSASSLRLAVKAVRAGFVARLRAELPVIEQIYLEELMTTRDANEGIQAFLEKRHPRWEDR